MRLLVGDVFNKKVTFDILSSSEGRISSYTLLFRNIHYKKKTIKLFLGVRKDVFRSLLKSLLSRGWAMFTFLSDAMFLTIFILNVAMF